MTRGRPKLPARKRKAAILTLRLTDAAQDRLTKAADARKISVSDYARSLINGLAPVPQKQVNAGGRSLLHWGGTGEERIVIDTPAELKADDWRRIKRYVEDVLRPATAPASSKSTNPTPE